jgi:hypothetical protein
MVPLPARIEDWAKTNEFQIVSAERRRFFVGPFSLRRNAGQICRIVLRGRDGDMREGWLSLQNDYAGNTWEEAKWIRKPAHTVDPRPEDAIAQQIFGVAKMGPTTGKWSFGFVMALLFVGWVLDPWPMAGLSSQGEGLTSLSAYRQCCSHWG